MKKSMVGGIKEYTEQIESRIAYNIDLISVHFTNFYSFINTEYKTLMVLSEFLRIVTQTKWV